MPNWCANTLRVTASTDVARALLPEVARRFELGTPFQFLVPMAAELLETDTWFDWRVHNWGTKWDAAEATVGQIQGDALLLVFDTAWSPPLGVYARLHELGFDVFATYAEQGIGFAGAWINGRDVELSLVLPDADGEEEDGPDDQEVLEATFAGLGIEPELLPVHLGG